MDASVVMEELTSVAVPSGAAVVMDDAEDVDAEGATGNAGGAAAGAWDWLGMATDGRTETELASSGRAWTADRIGTETSAVGGSS